MRFVKIPNFELMKKGTSMNGRLTLNEDIIEESVIHNVFDNAPIIYNEHQTLKDYRDEEIVENFYREKCIGVILPDTVDFNGFDVTGDVVLLEEFKNRTHFDNWYIEYDKDKPYFKYLSCELFLKMILINDN